LRRRPHDESGFSQGGRCRALVGAAAAGARVPQVNYGARSTTLDEAQRLLVELDEFAAWAEGML
jgi:hypothetical protein